jgi:hypothetical protein
VKREGISSTKIEILLLNQARMAKTAAPTTPATPMFTALTLAAPLEGLAEAPVVVLEDDEEELAGLVVVAAAVLAGVVTAGVVTAGVLDPAMLLLLLLPPALTDPLDEAALLELPPAKQPVVPGLIVKAAD